MDKLAETDVSDEKPTAGGGCRNALTLSDFQRLDLDTDINVRSLVSHLPVPFPSGRKRLDASFVGAYQVAPSRWAVAMPTSDVDFFVAKARHPLAVDEVAGDDRGPVGPARSDIGEVVEVRVQPAPARKGGPRSARR